MVLPRAPQLVALDCVLRAPRGCRQRLLAHLKRLTFRKVSLFLNYFADASEVCRHFGVCGDRTRYVPFKANIFASRASDPQPDGKYVLCFGWSFRDYDTFFDAVRISGLPAAVTELGISGARRHAGIATRERMSLCSSLDVLPDDGSAESQVELIRGARIVVVPILPGSIVASGIGTILNAMALGKCVIATQGIGVSDVFEGELQEVPSRDPAALAARLTELWSDSRGRFEIARKGHRFAIECGSEADLFERVIGHCERLSVS